MGILAALLFIFGVYVAVKRFRGREVPEDTREFGARIGRSAHAAIPLPGLMGQSSADLLPSGPIEDRVGTDEHHLLVVDAAGRPLAQEAPPMPNAPYREPPLKRRRRRSPR